MVVVRVRREPRHDVDAVVPRLTREGGELVRLPGRVDQQTGPSGRARGPHHEGRRGREATAHGDQHAVGDHLEAHVDTVAGRRPPGHDGPPREARRGTSGNSLDAAAGPDAGSTPETRAGRVGTRKEGEEMDVFAVHALPTGRATDPHH